MSRTTGDKVCLDSLSKSNRETDTFLAERNAEIESIAPRKDI